LAGHKGLSVAAQNAINDEANEIHVRAATAWEITTKHRLGELPGLSAIVADLGGRLPGKVSFR
jgi:PIN domain nuclease of toxin-antitoxin system